MSDRPRCATCKYFCRYGQTAGICPWKAIDVMEFDKACDQYEEDMTEESNDE